MPDPDDDLEQHPSFPDIETPEPDDAPSDAYLGEWQTREEAEQGLSELQQQLESLQTGQDEWRAELEELRREMSVGAPPSPQQRQVPQFQPVTLDDLPDPTEDFRSFKDALARKLYEQQAQAVQFAHYTTQAATSQLSQREQMNQLWQSFAQEFPDVAENDLAVRGAAAVEISELMRRYPGHDPYNLMLHDPQGFMNRVATRVIAASPMEGEEDAEPVTPRPRPRGAAIPGRRGGNGAPPAREPESSFMREMRELRAKSGFF